jgi:hypothetical protein
MRRPSARGVSLAAALAVLALALVVLVIARSSPSGHSQRSAADAHGGDGPHTTSHRGVGPAAGPRLLRAAAPSGAPVSVVVADDPQGPPVPRDFLGLSFEVGEIPRLAGYATADGPGSGSNGGGSTGGGPGDDATGGGPGDGELAALLRSLGSGVLRLGGVSADLYSAWSQPGLPPPRWARTAITSADLARIAALARATGWHVLLTVNLGHYDPAAAAREVAAARALLGSDLAGVELGNEPDAYVGKGLRARGWNFAAYRPQAAAYRAAIAAVAPGVAIAGPDPSSGLPGLRWVRAAARTLRPALLTDHYYPLSSCGSTPTVAELLSPVTRAAESAMLARMAAIARAHATPLRLDETNNVSCEGQPGVSDSFASALWALDFVVRAMDAGLAGIDFHDLLNRPDAYSPLVIRHRPDGTDVAGRAGTLHANPEWYALLAARSLPGGRPLPTHVAGAPAVQLSAGALREPDGSLALVLVDFEPPGSQPLAVRLRLPGRFADGSVLRLTAPSPTATGGVRLGGRAVAPDGSWTTPSALPGVHRGLRGWAGSLSLQMSPSSAAIMTLRPG